MEKIKKNELKVNGAPLFCYKRRRMGEKATQAVMVPYEGRQEEARRHGLIRIKPLLESMCNNPMCKMSL